jgi:hypothetical protein
MRQILAQHHVTESCRSHKQQLDAIPDAGESSEISAGIKYVARSGRRELS